MPNMTFRVAMAGALLAAAACGANAATFDLARRSRDGAIVPGLRIEGEIVPGDAQRLLDSYAKYGKVISPVYPRSRGGDVEEAMRMGTIIRRLRLETSVPVWDTGEPPVDLIKVDRPEDTVCASACFLVYAGGATRFGNYLAMHRPYLARKEAQVLSDVELEAAQKAMDSTVKAYLADMEVDQYWIDRMFSANSQEYYMPTWDEADSKIHHLMDTVPSLEEVVLSKCKEDPDVDQKMQAFRASRSGPLTAADVEKMKEITRESDVFYECEKTMLSDMQDAAFARENEPALIAKCGPLPLTPSENSTLRALIAKGDRVTPDEAATRQVLWDTYRSKYEPNRQCRTEIIIDLGMAAVNRWAEEQKESLRRPPPPVTEDFNAKGLSGAEMAKRGKDAYKAERWDVAARWFRMAADLGDAEGMMGMNWIYGNGKGVPENDAEAHRWRRMAAEHGSTDAMDVLAYDYEHGEGVTQDYTEAMRWHRKAADMGDASAMTQVGELYKSGRGVPQDYSEAMRWFRKAADAGQSFALVQIGWLYEFGLGVRMDEEQTRQWMEKAVTSDDDTGKIVANQWLIDHPSQ